jgi:hypothetical protein
MEIDRAGVGFTKKVILHLRRPHIGIEMRLLFTEQTAVFGFYSNDPVHGIN